MDKNFNKIYDFSGNVPIKLSVNCSSGLCKPLLQNFTSFKSMDYAEVRYTITPLVLRLRRSINCSACPTQIQNGVQIWCPWITSSVSNPLKRLKMQKDILAQKPTSYRKLKRTQLENSVAKNVKKIKRRIKKGW